MLTRPIELGCLQEEVERAARDVWLNAHDMEGYRCHRGARPFLQQPEVMDDLERARDLLSRVIDDVRGKV